MSDCPSGKIKIPTRKEARAARRSILAAGFGDFGRPYLCPHCGWFHLGHAPPGASRHGSARAAVADPIEGRASLK